MSASPACIRIGWGLVRGLFLDLVRSFVAELGGLQQLRRFLGDVLFFSCFPVRSNLAERGIHSPA
jgi:hypothetical protein